MENTCKVNEKRNAGMITENVWPLYMHYKKHTTVRALKIRTITIRDDNSGVLKPEDPKFSIIHVSKEFFKEWAPLEGGYYIVSSRRKEYMSASIFEQMYKKVPIRIEKKNG